MSCGVHKLCRKPRETRGDTNSVGYSVAVSNHMFREESSKVMPPCLNCILIEMGEMACYQERCPQCGKIPPGRRLQPTDLKKKSSIKYQMKHSSNMTVKPMIRSGEQTSQISLQGFVQKNSFSKEYKLKDSYSMESISDRTVFQPNIRRVSSDCNV